MSGVISAVSKVVEKVKSALSHGAGALRCLMKGDIAGAMGQVQTGCMDCLMATRAVRVPGLTLEAQASAAGPTGFDPWSMWCGWTNRQPRPTPLKGIVARIVRFAMARGMGMPRGLPMGGMQATGVPHGMPVAMWGVMRLCMATMQPQLAGGVPSMQIAPGAPGAWPPARVADGNDM